jgi:RHS repeat-associated protein
VIAVTAEGRIPALTSSEDIFSLAVPFVACSENRIGANAPEGKKTHQGIFSKNRTIAVSATRAKWSGTHQDSETWGGKTVLEIAIDANGNTLSDPSGKSYSWDFENRMTQAVVPGTNGGTTTFKYDPFGRRIQKSGPLGTTNYLYDAPNLLQEIDNGGNTLARYTQGGIDEPFAESRAMAASYYEQDFIGSVTSLTNGTGALANTYTYDSFGKLTASTGTLTNRFQFTGREFDSETGIYFYRARYYDSAQGRFISEDPIRFDGGNDFYTYVHDNPVLFRDPTGLCPPLLGVQCPCVKEAGLIRGILCTYGCTCPDGHKYISLVKCSLTDPYAGKLCPATYTITVRAGAVLNPDVPAPGFCGPVKPN